MIRRLLLISALLCLTPFPALAQDESDLPQDTIVDSVYFTMDDGIMTEAEMKLEAAYVHRECARDPYQSLYYDCGCVAGAFLIRREKDGPMTPQTNIIEDVLINQKAECANTPAIAGNAYKSCRNYKKIFHPLDRDAEEYCSCVGNKVALDFPRMGRLNSGNVRKLNASAMTFCKDPNNRPKPAQNSAAAAPPPAPETGTAQ